jgi:hypothetical protein
MKRWMIGAVAGACIGVTVYLLLTRKSDPAPKTAPEPPAVGVATPPPPSDPQTLAQVVEVTDLDFLLDPPQLPISGEPFETALPSMPTFTPAIPKRIPPAID